MIYTPLTKKAMKISFEAHKDQLDKSGLPYVYHPFHVAEQMDDQYAVCVALLHDVVEDSDVTFDDLRREGFPETVISAIAMMTHDDSVPYLQYVQKLKENPLAKKVKLADLRHNSDLSRLDVVTPTDIERAEKYQKAIALLERKENPNVQMLEETIEIAMKGCYRLAGKEIRLKTDPDRMREARVYLPDEVDKICKEEFSPRRKNTGDCRIDCKNMDSFTMAREIVSDPKRFSPDDRILVLNFANPVHIGGGVRQGARAQEEDLCRQSSLLLSLESEEAFPYYNYNRRLHTMLGSDAMIISPNVEIIRDLHGDLLDETAVVSVLTCAAPYIRDGFEGKTFDEYCAMMKRRIRGMLYAAADEGYTHLVFGAWGCGAFGNDPQLIARLFDEEIRSFICGGEDYQSFFRRIDFAVLSRSPGMYNYRVFANTFSR